MYCTCTVSSSNDVYHISGAGIYAIRAAPQFKSRPIANNELILSAGNSFSVNFMSNSSQSGVGMIIVPDGHTVSSGDRIGVWKVYNPAGRPGELRLQTFKPLPSTSQGIYTVTIPDSNNNMFIFNVGLYPIGFNGKTINILFSFPDTCMIS